MIAAALGETFMPQITPFDRAALIEFLGLCSSPEHTSAAPTRRAPPTPAAPRQGPTGGVEGGGGAVPGRAPRTLPGAARRDRTGRFVPSSAAPLPGAARPVPSGRRTRVRGAAPGAGPESGAGDARGLLDKGQSGGVRRGRRDARGTEGGARDAPLPRSGSRPPTAVPAPGGAGGRERDRRVRGREAAPAAPPVPRRPPTARCDAAVTGVLPATRVRVPGGPSLRPAPRRFPPCTLPPASPRESPRAAAPFVSPSLPSLAAVPLPLLSPAPPPLCAHTPERPPRGSQQRTARTGTLRARCARPQREGGHRAAGAAPNDSEPHRGAAGGERCAGGSGVRDGAGAPSPLVRWRWDVEGGAALPQVSIGPGPSPPTTPVPKETERGHRGNNNLFK